MIDGSDFADLALTNHLKEEKEVFYSLKHLLFRENTSIHVKEIILEILHIILYTFCTKGLPFLVLFLFEPNWPVTSCSRRSSSCCRSVICSAFDFPATFLSTRRERRKRGRKKIDVEHYKRGIVCLQMIFLKKLCKKSILDN